MNATEHFIFVHMPKTGGTFVSSAIGHLYGDQHPYDSKIGRLVWGWKRMRYQLTGRKLIHHEFDKHGTCRDIPPQFTHLPIVSCMRNPYDWYVSNYKFAFWKTHPQHYPGLADDPRWPNIDFATYLELSASTWLGMYNPNVTVNPTMSRLTVLFINYYCKHPDHILSLPADTPDLVQQVRNDLFPIHFLDTGQLNHDLYAYLNRYYQADQLSFIKEKDKISPRNRRRPDEKWPDFYTPTLLEQVRQADRVLFELFPQYDMVEKGGE